MNLAVLDTLLAFHFVGLMLGAGGGIGSALAMRHALTLPPEQASVIRGLGPTLSHTSGAGVVVMWLSGIGLVLWKYNGDLSGMPVMFWVKMAAVASLTLAAFLIGRAYAQLRKGNAAAAANLPKLGPVAGVSSLLAVIFAVLAFH